MPSTTRSRLSIWLTVSVAVLVVAGCSTGTPGGGSSTTTPTSTSTSPSGGMTASRGPRLAVITGASGHEVLGWVDLAAHVDPAARIGGLSAPGGADGGSAYVLVNEGASRVDADGTVVALDVVQHATPSLAVSASGPTTLGWGDYSPTATSLLISPATGTTPATAISEPPPPPDDAALYAGRWSRDSRYLYYGLNPTGLGGYGPFGRGLTSLSRYDVTTHHAADLIPYRSGAGVLVLCIDDLSYDEQHVADTCTRRTVTIRDLVTGTRSTVGSPPAASAFTHLLDARFSPDGARVAFALDKGDPEHEQGAVAVSSGLGGTARLVMTGPSGSALGLDGWLDGSTLLIELYQVHDCTDSCMTIWTVDIATGRSTRIAAGRVGALSLG